MSLVPAASDKVIAETSGDKKKNISKAATKSEKTPNREVRRKRSAGKDMKITSKAAVESSNRDGNSLRKLLNLKSKGRTPLENKWLLKHQRLMNNWLAAE
ncbi:hypothetical protein Ddye_004254 [Dipteronia dyeriana]|uniref:Uncharacterized protein n=1 Tax=Dipteronia dyeriana TaxID=168575 RepID=A0AAE0CW46_9ROSI|nr:hypothetical protein Ddye_004254 [Dipteronia dyeriana]